MDKTRVSDGRCWKGRVQRALWIETSPPRDEEDDEGGEDGTVETRAGFFLLRKEASYHQAAAGACPVDSPDKT